jgi:DNA-binding IclR family transcriptional regulator
VPSRVKRELRPYRRDVGARTQPADGTGGPDEVGTKGQPSVQAHSQVQSVDRALAVLDILARRGEVGVTELAAALDVHKSTASRLVGALEVRELVEQIGDRGKYRLGAGILRLAAATTGHLEVTGQARPVCVALAREFGETVNVAILDLVDSRRAAAINVLQEFGATSSVASRDWIGRRTPLHATSSGKVLLAHADATTQDDVLGAPLERYTPRTVTDVTALRRQLDDVLRRGWASTSEELEVGLNAVASPVRDAGGVVVAAVSVSGPAYRFRAGRFPAVGERLAAAGAEISTRMGWFARA